MMLTRHQRDALTELFNIGVGRAAASLSDLVGVEILLTVPSVRVGAVEGLVGHGADERGVAIMQSVTGAVEGRAVLAFPPRAAVTLAQLLAGRPAEEVDELEYDLAGILEEVGNIVLNSLLGTLANGMDRAMTLSLPRVMGLAELLDSLGRDASLDAARGLIVADADFHVSNSTIHGQFLLMADMSCLERVFPELEAAVRRC